MQSRTIEHRRTSSPSEKAVYGDLFSVVFLATRKGDEVRS